MADIIMADDGIAFDGRALQDRPLGGAETSFIELANAFARHGHRVRAYARCEAPVTCAGVEWLPHEEGFPGRADLYIANRASTLLSRVPEAKHTVFWIHNPASYTLKWRYQWRLALRQPVIVFSGPSHAASYPEWAFARARLIIPYGISEMFRHAPLRTTPPKPRAVFTSNPLRSLDWLLDLWDARISTAVPGAELHVFAGPATYGAAGNEKAALMAPILARAQSLAAKGVILRGPVPKPQLVTELLEARVCLYRGDIGETFCSAVAEAQAMAVPAVVEDIACMRERVRDGETGFVVEGGEAFADAAIRLLTDDALWRRQHEACLSHQRSFGWDQAAGLFETILAGERQDEIRAAAPLGHTVTS